MGLVVSVRIGGGAVCGGYGRAPMVTLRRPRMNRRGRQRRGGQVRSFAPWNSPSGGERDVKVDFRKRRYLLSHGGINNTASFLFALPSPS